MLLKKEENKKEWTLYIDTSNPLNTGIYCSDQDTQEWTEADKLNIYIHGRKNAEIIDSNLVDPHYLSCLEDTTELTLNGCITKEDYANTISLLISLFKNMPSIKRISFEQSFSTLNAPLNELFSLFQSFINLKSISLNNYLSRSIESFIESFKHTKLKELSFFANHISEHTMKEFMPLIAPKIAKQIQRLKIIDFSSNFPPEFFECMSTSTCLKSLRLKNFPLTLLKQLTASINKNKSLTEITLDLNSIIVNHTMREEDLSEISPICLPSLNFLRITTISNSILCTDMIKKLIGNSSFKTKELELTGFLLDIELLKVIANLLKRNELISLSFNYTPQKNDSDPLYTIFCPALSQNTSLRVLDARHLVPILLSKIFYQSISASRLETVIFENLYILTNEIKKSLDSSRTLLSMNAVNPGMTIHFPGNLEKKRQHNEILRELQRAKVDLLEKHKPFWSVYLDILDKIDKLLNSKYPHAEDLLALFCKTFICHYAELYSVENPDNFKFAIRSFNHLSGHLSPKRLPPSAIYQVSSMLSRATKEDGGLDTEMLNIFSLVLLQDLDKTILMSEFQERIRHALILHYERLGKRYLSWDMEIITGKKIVVPWNLFTQALESDSVRLGADHHLIEHNSVDKLNSISSAKNIDQYSLLSRINLRLKEYLGYSLSEIAILEDIICNPKAYPLKKEELITCKDNQWSRMALYKKEMAHYFIEISEVTNILDRFELINQEANRIKTMVYNAIYKSKSSSYLISTAEMLAPTAPIFEDILKEIKKELDQNPSDKLDGEIKESKQEIGLNENSHGFFNTSGQGVKNKRKLNETSSPEPGKPF